MEPVVALETVIALVGTLCIVICMLGGVVYVLVRRLATAERDELTKLMRRGPFRMWTEGSIRRGRAVAVAVVDVDRLASINSRHGLQVGDQVIVAVARMLRAAAGPPGLVTRVYGGLFMVTVTSQRALLTVAEMLTDEFKVSAGGRELTISAALGAVVHSAAHAEVAAVAEQRGVRLVAYAGLGAPLDDIERRAERAMRACKEGRRVAADRAA